LSSKIRKVLITTSSNVGGVRFVMESLYYGFSRLGIESELVNLNDLITNGKRLKELRDTNILKILNLHALFISPLCKNCISVAHGFPRKDTYKLHRYLGILSAYMLASKFSKFIAISEFTKMIIESIMGIKMHGVIHNPIPHDFADLIYSGCNRQDKKEYITYVGRFHPDKKIDIFINPLKELLKQYTDYKVLIVGYGPLKEKIQNMIGEDYRFIIVDKPSRNKIKDILLKSKVFFSGNPFEPFGITYLEALACGCNLVMPNFGGGIEIAPEYIGKRIFTYYLPATDERIYEALKKALVSENIRIDLSEYLPERVAMKYLEVAKNG